MGAGRPGPFRRRPVTRAEAALVVDLMRKLTEEHRWGLAAKGFAAKGGWGPGLSGDYLVRQFAIVSRDGWCCHCRRRSTHGGYETGVDVVNTLTDWVVDQALAQY